MPRPSADRQKRIFLRADKTVPYGELMRVMNLLRSAGYLKLALVGLEDASAQPVAAPADAPAASPAPAAARRRGHDVRDRPARAAHAPASCAGRGRPLFVVAAHVGCTALALMHWQEDDADDAAASPVVVEMVPAPAATPVDSPDVAHGPLMEEAMLTPQAAKETKEEVEKEMPTVEPSPAPDPEVVLPTPHPVTDKKPDEEKPQGGQAQAAERRPGRGRAR